MTRLRRICFLSCFIVIVCLFCDSSVKAQAQRKVRLAKIEVDSAQLETYQTLLKEGIEASMRLEKGVLALYAVFEKDHPNQLTVLEIYADEQAYNKHIQTPHFKKYKEQTRKMVKTLELIEVLPLLPNMNIKSLVK